jgi:hypothetical protein
MLKVVLDEVEIAVIYKTTAASKVGHDKQQPYVLEYNTGRVELFASMAAVREEAVKTFGATVKFHR